ncbi:larval cuticle protein A3A-like isoform X2 [Anticarsia gemmatalis]|uniref:larval cuticle protein A3A-like isoform X2 n=1 Tax=Anticarsia gemmatalis TaxID=129554 RepID=UPI003F76D670
MNQYLMIACVLAAAVSIASANPVRIVPVIENDHPRYAFNYAVSDPHTRDSKAQWETRNGDVVKGSYSLVEPDGTLRVVDYHADDHSGFNAVVKKIGPAVHGLPLLSKTIAPLTTIAGPVSYGFGAAPIVANLPKLTSLGQWSLPWDPFTHSYGGWVPLAGAPLIEKPFLTISTKQVDGHGTLHKWISGPIPLAGSTLVIRKKH